MHKKLAIGILSLIFTAGLSTPSWAETVIEKVARTGVLTAGTRSDAVPLSYIDARGEWAGYSVEILRLIRERLEGELGKKVDLEFVEVKVQERIPKLIGEEVDIICEAVSYTWGRERYVDYSVSYGMTGTRLLAKKGSNLETSESLIGKRIGVIPDSTNEQVIKLVQPKAILVPMKDNLQEALKAVERGKIDAFAGDGLLLEGLRITLSDPNRFEVLPKTPYNREGIACMVPENDSSFRDMVNFTIVKFLQEVVTGKGNSADLFGSWFGNDGIVRVDRDLVVNFFNYVIDSHSQIPPEDRKAE